MKFVMVRLSRDYDRGINHMGLYEDIVAGKEKLSLVGLGYVGMPIAVAFAKKINVVGFDLNAAKIDLYKNGKNYEWVKSGDLERYHYEDFSLEQYSSNMSMFLSNWYSSC